MDDVEYTERVSCPLCGTFQNHKWKLESAIINKRKIALGINKCRACKLIYISPRLNHIGLDWWYNRYEDTVSGQYNASKVPQRLRYTIFRDIVSSLIPLKGRLLDVGTGVGLFPDTLRDLDINVQATEFSPVAASVAMKAGHDVLVGDLLQIENKLNAPFDVITFIDVLEHLPQPRAYLECVHRLLVPQGTLVVSVPNYYHLRVVHASFLSSLIRRQPPTIYPAEHLQNFTKRTLTHFLNITEFEVIEWKSNAPIFVGNHGFQLMKRVGWTVLRKLKFFQRYVLGYIAIAKPNKR